MARRALLLLLAGVAFAQDADEYFEIGVDYLKKGFFGPARRAFGESLALAPGQPVPLAFMGLAGAAEGRDPAEAALLFRDAYASLPEGKTFRLDLAQVLPSPKALRILEESYARRIERAGKRDLRDVLTVAAFLEVHGGGGATPSLDRLEREFPGDACASRLRASVRPCSPPTTPPTSSGPTGAAAGSRSSRTRS